jgi:hypothetical protein
VHGWHHHRPLKDGAAATMQAKGVVGSIKSRTGSVACDRTSSGLWEMQVLLREVQIVPFAAVAPLSIS